MQLNIIELARQAGLRVGTNISGVRLVGVPMGNSIAHLTVEDLGLFANLVAAAVKDEAAKASGEYAKKWWHRHSATNKHMTTTREAHDDFCALQAYIRAMEVTT